MQNLTTWLDNAVGLENFPEEVYYRAGNPPSLLGIDKATGGLVFTGPPGTPPGQLITQGVINTALDLALYRDMRSKDSVFRWGIQ